MINKILLFGSTGMLGRYIYLYFKNNTTISIECIDYRIINEYFNDLEDILKSYNINNNTCVINCIGIIPQRSNINTTYKQYILVNGLFPNILAKICNKHNAEMIQPSTDCVFSGIHGNYYENDTPDDHSLYGLSKYFGEPEGCSVIRTSIIGFEYKNKKSLIEWLISSNNKTIDGWNNHIWNGITCLEFCKVIDTIIKKELFWKGIRHIYSPDTVTKYELLVCLKNLLNLNITINLCNTTNSINKKLNSNYNLVDILNIKPLETQLIELRQFSIS